MVAVTVMSYGNIIVAVKCKIQLVEVIVFTEATVVNTTEATASVASNVATAMLCCIGFPLKCVVDGICISCSCIISFHHFCIYIVNGDS